MGCSLEPPATLPTPTPTTIPHHPPPPPVCIWMHLVNGTGNSRPTSGVVKQDKSSGGSVDTTKTRSGPQRVRMSSGERPIGATKGNQPNTEALCQTPPPPWFPLFPPMVHHPPPPPQFPPTSPSGHCRVGAVRHASHAAVVVVPVAVVLLCLARRAATPQAPRPCPLTSVQGHCRFQGGIQVRGGLAFAPENCRSPRLGRRLVDRSVPQQERGTCGAACARVIGGRRLS